MLLALPGEEAPEGAALVVVTGTFVGPGLPADTAEAGPVCSSKEEPSPLDKGACLLGRRACLSGEREPVLMKGLPGGGGLSLWVAAAGAAVGAVLICASLDSCRVVFRLKSFSDPAARQGSIVPRLMFTGCAACCSF